MKPNIKVCSENAARAAQTEFADRQRIALDLELGESPGMRPWPERCSADVGFEKALLLLKMVWPEEQAFRPHNTVVFGHRDMMARRNARLVWR